MNLCPSSSFRAANTWVADVTRILDGAAGGNVRQTLT
jgi:hypothetical protein